MGLKALVLLYCDVVENLEGTMHCALVASELGQDESFHVSLTQCTSSDLLKVPARLQHHIERNIRSSRTQ